MCVALAYSIFSTARQFSSSSGQQTATLPRAVLKGACQTIQETLSLGPLPADQHPWEDGQSRGVLPLWLPVPWSRGCLKASPLHVPPATLRHIHLRDTSAQHSRTPVRWETDSQACPLPPTYLPAFVIAVPTAQHVGDCIPCDIRSLALLRPGLSTSPQKVPPGSTQRETDRGWSREAATKSTGLGSMGPLFPWEILPESSFSSFSRNTVPCHLPQFTGHAPGWHPDPFETVTMNV